MAQLSRYCKAYTLADCRKFAGWHERASAASPEGTSAEAGGESVPRTLTDESVVYVHDTFLVTDDIFVDEHVLFDAVSPEWEQFCRTTLGFDPAGALASTTT